tara:strand:- start:242 stop:1258 length:1017 start_codon:yes stop_codon:yes gene_type:complete
MNAFPVVNVKDEALVSTVVENLSGVGLNVARVRDYGPEVSEASKEIAGSVFGALKEATSGNMGADRFQGLNQQVYLATFETVERETRDYWETHKERLESKGYSWTDRQEDDRTIKGFRSACLDSVSNLRIKMVWISYAFGAGEVVLPDGTEINFRRDTWSFIKDQDATLHGVYTRCQQMLLDHCLPNLGQRFSLYQLDENGDPVQNKDGKKITIEYSFTSHEELDSYQDQLAEVETLMDDDFASYNEVTEAQELLGRMKDAMVKSFKDQDAFKGLIIDGRTIAKIRKMEADQAEAERIASRSAEEAQASEIVTALLKDGVSIEDIRSASAVLADSVSE